MRHLVALAIGATLPFTGAAKVAAGSTSGFLGHTYRVTLAPGGRRQLPERHEFGDLRAEPTGTKCADLKGYAFVDAREARSSYQLLARARIEGGICRLDLIQHCTLSGTHCKPSPKAEDFRKKIATLFSDFMKGSAQRVSSRLLTTQPFSWKCNLPSAEEVGLISTTPVRTPGR